MTDIVKWADPAMFEATPMLRKEGLGVVPQVFLLSATPDPLGALAAAYRMYAGYPTYSLADLTDDERKQAWEDSLKTQLKAPWEFIDMHFFIEGVTRAFTHQMVRQRTAVYAQESLRFAVKEGLAQEVPLPPSLVNGDESVVTIWQDTIQRIEDAYTALVNAGVPAEDARGLLPHATTTRLNYKTNYRGLIEHAGNRLCTQAQFEWRSVYVGIMNAIKKYDADTVYRTSSGLSWRASSNWQFELLGSARPETFSPICYKAGHCTFMGEIDRPCSIRERVQSNARNGIEPEDWYNINPVEWMADPNAARKDET